MQKYTSVYNIYDICIQYIWHLYTIYMKSVYNIYDKAWELPFEWVKIIVWLGKTFSGFTKINTSDYGKLSGDIKIPF